MANRQKVLYSNLELKVLDNIPEDGTKINTIELVERVYPIEKRPHNARQAILNAAEKLILKVDDNDEDYEIFRSVNVGGSRPINFWRERRKRGSDNDTKESF